MLVDFQDSVLGTLLGEFDMPSVPIPGHTVNLEGTPYKVTRDAYWNKNADGTWRVKLMVFDPSA